MGTFTTLTGISINAAGAANASGLGMDAIGMLQSAQTKAQELVIMLNAISSRLPAGDANIATIATVITNLG